MNLSNFDKNPVLNRAGTTSLYKLRMLILGVYLSTTQDRTSYPALTQIVSEGLIDFFNCNSDTVRSMGAIQYGTVMTARTLLQDSFWVFPDKFSNTISDTLTEFFKLNPALSPTMFSDAKVESEKVKVESEKVKIESEKVKIEPIETPPVLTPVQDPMHVELHALLRETRDMLTKAGYCGFISLNSVTGSFSGQYRVESNFNLE